MNDISFNYYGKTYFKSSELLMMALGQGFHKFEPLLKFVTTEMFNHECVILDKKKWFLSYPYGIEAIKTGARILNLENNFEIMVIENDTQHHFEEQLQRQMKKGSLIFGPINTAVIWDHMDSRYFQGYANFIYIFEYSDGYYKFHDPVNCPHMRLLSKMLWESVKDEECLYTVSIKIDKAKKEINKELLCQSILGELIQNRLNLHSLPTAYHKWLYFLSCQYESRKIKASEKLALICSMHQSGISIQYLREFLSIYESYFNFEDVIKCCIKDIKTLLIQYHKELSYMQMYLDENSDSNITCSLDNQICFENNIYESFFELKHKMRLLKG